MESNGHIVVQRVLWLQTRTRTETGAVRPKINQVQVVGRRFALAKAEDVSERQGERDERDRERLREADLERAEEQQKRHDEDENAADDIPKEVAVETPRSAAGIV